MKRRSNWRRHLHTGVTTVLSGRCRWGLETIDRFLLNHAGVWCEPRGIFQRARSARTNERAALRWGVIYVAEGGNCPRILCPACPRGHTFQPAVSTVNNVPRVVPKRFLVSAVILAINRRPPPLIYRVSCPACQFFIPFCPVRASLSFFLTLRPHPLELLRERG